MANIAAARLLIPAGRWNGIVKIGKKTNLYTIPLRTLAQLRVAKWPTPWTRRHVL
jgi:hypothetical protein